MTEPTQPPPSPPVWQPGPPLEGSTPAPPQTYSATQRTATAINPKRGRGMAIWGAILLVLSAVIGIGGIIGGLVFAKSSLDGVNDLTRVETPSETTLTLNEGKLQIWAEADSQLALDNASLRVIIRDPALDQDVPIDFPSSTQNYNLDGRYGKLIGTAQIPGTRDFTVITTGNGDARAALGNLNIFGMVFGTIGLVFTGIGIGSILGITGLILLIVGLVKRSNTKRRLAAGT